MRVFIDSNLWVYRLDRREPAKSERIRRWLAAVARRKLVPPLSDGQISELLEALVGFEVVSTDANLVMDAHLLASCEKLSWFDALIAEAAIRSRCSILFSEDFSHGRRIAGLELINPFLEPASGD
jgi:predicted nucleic acid-binding protein